MNKYKVKLSNGKEYTVESKDFIECYNNALKGEENYVEIVLIELVRSGLTEVEKIILENTDERFKFIARDEDGELMIYKDKPYKEDEYWELPEDEEGYHFYERTATLHAYKHLFQNIKWEDEEPYKFR